MFNRVIISVLLLDTKQLVKFGFSRRNYSCQATSVVSFDHTKNHPTRETHNGSEAKNNLENQVGISSESLTQSDYYFENGLRKVHPYYFGKNFLINCKHLN